MGKIMNLSWTEKIANEEVFRKARVKPSLISNEKEANAICWTHIQKDNICWIMNKGLEGRLEATETWLIGKIMNLSWTEKIANEEVFRKARIKPSLINTRERQMQFVSHIYRKDILETAILTKEITGKRSRGRQCLTHLQCLNKWATKSEIRITSLLKGLCNFV